jgi:hypothetical protein
MDKKEKKRIEEEKFAKLIDAFNEHNTMQVFAKMMLASSGFRRAQVKRVQLILDDGSECEFDCRQSKTLKRFMQKLKKNKTQV